MLFTVSVVVFTLFVGCSANCNDKAKAPPLGGNADQIYRQHPELAAPDGSCRLTGNTIQYNTWWAQDTTWFLSCLSGHINSDLTRIESLVGERTFSLAADFNGGQCWRTYNNSKRPNSLDQSNSSYAYFQNTDSGYFKEVLEDSRNSFFSTNADVERIKVIISTAERLIWEYIANSQSSSKCMINSLLDKFLSVMGTCIGNEMGFHEAIDIPITEFDTIEAVDPADKNHLKQFVEAYIKAYSLLRQCDDQYDSQCQNARTRMVAKINKITSDRVFECAQEYYSGCPQSYNAVCPYAHTCIMKLIEHPKMLFKDFDFITGLVTECFADSGHLTDIIAAGVDLMTQINELGAKEKAAFGKFAESTLKAHFPAEFCGTHKLPVPDEV